MSKTFLSAAALMLAATATAQNTDTALSRELEQVVVTANKVEQKQGTTGKVITVISNAELQKQQGKTVAQVLTEQAGLWINGATQNLGSTQSVFMRGAATGRTLILMDGIPMGDASQIVGDYDLNLFSINEVERIEICRGAQSTLYGSDAIAGVINIITTKNNISKPFNANVSVGLGNYNTTRANVQAFGKIGKFTYTARYAKLASNGFSSAYDSSANGRNFDRDFYNSDVVSTAITYQINEYQNIRAFVQNSAYRTGIDAGAFRDKRDFFADNNNLNTGFTYQFKKQKWTAQFNYQYGEYKRIFDDNFSIPGATNFSLNTFFAKSQFVEGYTSFQAAKWIKILLGADYRFGSMNNQFTSRSSFGPFNSSFNDTSMHQYSVYTTALVQFGKFFLEAGARNNTHSKYGNNTTFTFNPSVKINKNLHVLASISTGFKAPTLYQLYAGFGTGNPNLQPETSTNYEAGVQFGKKQLFTRLVGFHRDITNGIDYDNSRFTYFNFTKQKATGLEYEVRYTFNKVFSVQANYSYTKLTENTQSRITAKDTTYAYGLRRPGSMANIVFTVTPTKDFNFSITGRYASARNDVGGFRRADVNLDAFFIINAYAEYTYLQKHKLFLQVQNITGKRFFEIAGFNSMPALLSGGLRIQL
ncbi:MAG: TonB-dependent receptor [Bacteroidetes bacterium]|nr:MAG: TonB-dependent receptor [Bacteroidota bacterium]TAF92254.1 MAG: TonB-dependent receptor [Bacteroidota bacterium]